MKRKLAVKYTGKGYNTLFAALGAKGYDVVSYFADGKPDPVNGWTIQDGKLYLNFNAEPNGVVRGDPKKLSAKADEIWPKLDQ